MDNERVDKLIIWKLLEDNKALWEDNCILLEQIDLLENMLDMLEAQYDVMIGEMQEECEAKDRLIEDLQLRLGINEN